MILFERFRQESKTLIILFLYILSSQKNTNLSFMDLLHDNKP